MAAPLKALADPMRLRILDLLAQQRGPVCVCAITATFDLGQPTISHHLRILRQAGLIAGKKDGIWVYYWLTECGIRGMTFARALS
jgi:ArsR family transcriptional regulator